jgi:hypothetical protein
MKVTPNLYLNFLNEYSKVLSEARVTPINKDLCSRYLKHLDNFAKVRTYLRKQGVI